MNLDLVQQHQVVLRVQHYYPVGPAVQAQGFGWSLGSWGGEEQENLQQLNKWY